MIPQKHYFIAGGIAVALLIAGGILIWRQQANQALVTGPAPEETVLIHEEKGVFTIYNQGREIGKFNKGQDVERLRVLRRVGTTVYVGAYPPTDATGYMLFDTPAPRVVTIDILNHTSTFIARDSRLIGDISPDGQLIAWLSYGDDDTRLIIEDRAAQAEQEIVLPTGFAQFGDILFSPDGQRLAIAAAVGFPGRERGEVYQLKRGKKELESVAVSKEPNTYLRVRGWSNLKTVATEEVVK